MQLEQRCLIQLCLLLNLINSKALTQEYLDELQSYEKLLQDWFRQYEDKDISSWREFVMGNEQRRPITHAYEVTFTGTVGAWKS